MSSGLLLLFVGHDRGFMGPYCGFVGFFYSLKLDYPDNVSKGFFFFLVSWLSLTNFSSPGYV